MVKLEDQEWVINPNTGNKIDMKKLLQEQQLAHIYIDSNFPFFSSLLRNLTWIYTFQVPTQATDGTRLFVNPEFTAGLSIRMKAFVMMHEVMHCALDHMMRGKNHPHDRSNIAADYEVNGLLCADGVVSASDLAPYLYDKKYEGLNYEIIYSMNPPKNGPTPPPQKGGQQGSGSQGGGQSGQDGQQGQNSDQGPSNKDIDKMSGKEAANSAQDSANKAQDAANSAKSSGSKGDAKKAQDAANRAQNAADEARDAASRGDANTAREKAKEARDAANEAQNAAGNNNGQKGKGNDSGNSQASARARGNAAEACNSVGGFISQQDGAEIAKSEGYKDQDCKVESQSTITNDWKEAAIEACSKDNGGGPGNIVSRFKDYYISSHDWKNDLRKYVGRALSNVDDDTKLGKKKWLAQGDIKKYDRPSESMLDSVIFMVDVSGSVSDQLLQAIISECYTICVKKRIKKVTYCYYDDGIREMETNDTMKADGILSKDMVSRIKRGNAKPKADIHGRGGNSEDVALDEVVKIIRKSHKHPELLMWFTDGYTHAKPSKPSCIKNMIWVIYDNNNFTASDSSRVIHIKSADIIKK